MSADLICALEPMLAPVLTGPPARLEINVTSLARAWARRRSTGRWRDEAHDTFKLLPRGGVLDLLRHFGLGSGEERGRGRGSRSLQRCRVESADRGMAEASFCCMFCQRLPDRKATPFIAAKEGAQHHGWSGRGETKRASHVQGSARCGRELVAGRQWGSSFASPRVAFLLGPVGCKRPASDKRHLVDGRAAGTWRHPTRYAAAAPCT